MIESEFGRGITGVPRVRQWYSPVDRGTDSREYSRRRDGSTIVESNRVEMCGAIEVPEEAFKEMVVSEMIPMDVW